MFPLKVACVIKIKLFSYGLILLYFDNTNYVMQNTMHKFRQSSIVFEKASIFFESLKFLTSSNYPTVQYFLLNLRSFLLTNVYERVRGTFLILFRSWFICKNLKRPGFYTPVFHKFINNSRSKQNEKKSHTSFCRHYYVENVFKISAKKIKLYGSRSLLKFSIFQTENLISGK